MTLYDIAKKLESQRTNTLRTNGKNTNICGDETYGLSLSKIQAVAKEMQNDAVLADELYGSTNYDMKLLATLIDDPKSYTLDELTKRADQLYPSPFAEKFCRQVLANTEHAVHFIDKWLDCEDCNLQAYAYITLSELAKKQNNLGNDFYASHLRTIEDTIATETEDVRQAMQAAVKAIATRNETLRQKASLVAEIVKLSMNRRNTLLQKTTIPTA